VTLERSLKDVAFYKCSSMTPFRKQKYSACALISLINARISLGGDDVSPNTFEVLVDASGSRYGGAIRLNHIAKFLGLRRLPVKYDYKTVKRNLPIALSVFDKKWGLHSILLYGYKDRRFLVHNCSHFKKATWKELDRIFTHNKQISLGRVVSYKGVL